jgi:hypothetical protein
MPPHLRLVEGGKTTTSTLPSSSRATNSEVIDLKPLDLPTAID